MKIINIHDTKKSLLKSNYSGLDAGRMVRFLPSIALFKQDKKFNIYLLTYRIWRKRIKPKQNDARSNPRTKTCTKRRRETSYESH